MKILAIGNSFSQDSSCYLKSIAQSAGCDLTVVNLFIGGCSLQMHAENIAKDVAAYDYELNGSQALKKTSVKDALLSDAWDVVTIQQASHFSGQPETYEPFGSAVIDEIKKYAKGAKIYFHMTWAYETDANHGCFAWYDCDQQKMYHSIVRATEKFAKAHAIEIIPSGKVVQTLRAKKPFDYKNGGESLNRDGFHLSLTYGRYAAAATWFEKLCGGLEKADFAPWETQPEFIDVIKNTVKEVVNIAQ